MNDSSYWLLLCFTMFIKIVPQTHIPITIPMYTIGKRRDILYENHLIKLTSMLLKLSILLGFLSLIRVEIVTQSIVLSSFCYTFTCDTLHKSNKILNYMQCSMLLPILLNWREGTIRENENHIHKHPEIWGLARFCCYFSVRSWKNHLFIKTLHFLTWKIMNRRVFSTKVCFLGWGWGGRNEGYVFIGHRFSSVLRRFWKWVILVVE